MAAKMTREAVLAELVAAIHVEPVPEGWYSAREIYDFAQAAGKDVTLAGVRQRLKRAAEMGRIDVMKVGGECFYRMGEQGEV